MSGAASGQRRPARARRAGGEAAGGAGQIRGPRGARLRPRRRSARPDSRRAPRGGDDGPGGSACGPAAEAPPPAAGTGLTPGAAARPACACAERGVRLRAARATWPAGSSQCGTAAAAAGRRVRPGLPLGSRSDVAMLKKFDKKDEESGERAEALGEAGLPRKPSAPSPGGLLPDLRLDARPREAPGTCAKVRRPSAAGPGEPERAPLPLTRQLGPRFAG